VTVVVHEIPRTKLWREYDGFVIVLECTCGAAIEYPGHPDERESVECECGAIWTVRL
jgi:hypothetical protein